MRFPKSFEKIAELMERDQQTVFCFMTSWCGDCHYIKPYLPELEAENPNLDFVQLDRDDWMDLAQKWDIFGIPSFVVTQSGQEIGRLVNKNRKTKAEIQAFLDGIRREE